ncbi:hypothetical protein ACX13T_22410, partial [Salmonella enterica]
ICLRFLLLCVGRFLLCIELCWLRVFCWWALGLGIWDLVRVFLFVVIFDFSCFLVGFPVSSEFVAYAE